MRRAELVTVVVLAVFSVYLMWKSAELPVGWIKGSGPGGGAFPFWLGAGMLVCCALIGVRWARRTSGPSQSDEPFMDGRAFKLFLLGAGGLTAMIAAIHVVGVYVAIPLFLIYYIRFLGGHSWPLTGALAVITPVATFFFFEIALKITLPKGYTEPAFYPLFELFM